MEAIVFYPENEEQLNRITAFASTNNIKNVILNDQEKRKMAGIILANLAQKSPKAYAKDEEIISVVEEVRHEKNDKGI